MSNMPEWMSEKGKKKSVNKTSQKQEKARAALVGGKVQAGSGCSWRAPQDVKSPEYLEQIKFTNNSGHNIRVACLQQLLRDAEAADRIPRYVIDFEREGIRVVGTVERIRA